VGLKISHTQTQAGAQRLMLANLGADLAVVEVLRLPISVLSRPSSSSLLLSSLELIDTKVYEP